MGNVGTLPPSDHVLRTLAAVPPSSTILELGCGCARHTEALLRLGFPVHACDPRPEAVAETRNAVRDLLEQGSVDTVVQQASLHELNYPDALFDWVLAANVENVVSDTEELQLLFEEGRRLLKPGGWLYVSLPGDRCSDDGASSGGGIRFSEEEIEEYRKDADLAEASAPTRIGDETNTRIRAIYRRVEPQTPA